MKGSIRQKLANRLLLQYIGKSSPLQEMRKTFYRVIIVNMFWIDDDLPSDPDKKFEFSLNPGWADSPNPDNYIGLRHMSEDMLIYVCGRFKRPVWVDEPSALKVRMSLNEIVQQWPFLFDLASNDTKG
jgi:hypothetical protein